MFLEGFASPGRLRRKIPRFKANPHYSRDPLWVSHIIEAFENGYSFDFLYCLQLADDTLKYTMNTFMSQQKILFTLTPSFNPNDGGVQRTTWKLGEYFTNRGYTVAYYSFGVEGHVQPDHGTLYHSKKPGKAVNSENIQDLEKVLKEIRPDIVINQMPYEQGLRDLLSNKKTELEYYLLGCLRNSLFSFKSNARDKLKEQLPGILFKIIDNPPGMRLVQHRHKLKHRRDLKSIIDNHDYFILLAPPNREELCFFIDDYKKEKVVSIPNSIPAVHDDLSKKEKIILHVGRINISQKRSDLLPDFWEYLHDKVPDWKFFIVGDGPYYNELEKDFEKRKLPRVSLEGFREPESYYQKASVFMMPSAYEGFPNTLLEAQSFGCAPVLFNSFNALDWVVEDDVNACLVEPFDTKAMADNVVQLCKNGDQLMQMQQAALKNAGRFTIDKVGIQWEKFFQEKLHLEKENLIQ